MKFLCRVTDHHLSYAVLKEFARGTPGSLMASVHWGPEEDRISVYYGILRGCKEAIRDDMKHGRPWVYIDHGYFGDTDNETLTGNYRIVVGGLHPKIPEDPTPQDIRAMAYIRPMKAASRDAPVVLVPPSGHVADFYGIDSADWIRRFKTPFVRTVVSTKAENNLDDLLKDCYGVLAHSSTAAVKALLMGWPAWCTAERAPIPNHGQYTRQALLAWLDERQFTLGEIRDGRHLQFLRGEIENFRDESAKRSPGVGGGARPAETGTAAGAVR